MDYVNQIKKEMSKLSTPAKIKSSLRFYKNEIKCFGLKANEVKPISRKYFKFIKGMDIDLAYGLFERMYKTGYSELASLASGWCSRFKDKFREDDFKIFENWINKYIDNWAKCDSFCNHTMWEFLRQYPQYLKNLYDWAQSDNLWMRRASVVSLIIPVKSGLYLSSAFRLADILLCDNEDMVQKGYGWLLKEASRKYQKEVFDYVCSNKSTMPRTALRYAIELMPEKLRKEAMKRDGIN